MDWLKAFWSWLGPFWGSLLAATGGIASLEKGIKAIIGLWKWFVGLHDKRIAGILEGRDRFAQSLKDNDLSAVNVTWISNVAKRRPKSVLKSLRRLERQGKIHELIGSGWVFGTRKGKLEIQNLERELEEREAEKKIQKYYKEIEELARQKAKKGGPGLQSVEPGPGDDAELVKEAWKRFYKTEKEIAGGRNSRLGEVFQRLTRAAPGFCGAVWSGRSARL